MSQTVCGLLYFAGFHQVADAGGGDPPAIQKLLLDHPAGQVFPLAVFLQQLGGALGAAAEAEIVAADKTGGTLGAKLGDKILPIG